MLIPIFALLFLYLFVGFFVFRTEQLREAEALYACRINYNDDEDIQELAWRLYAVRHWYAWAWLILNHRRSKFREMERYIINTNRKKALDDVEELQRRYNSLKELEERVKSHE